MTARDILVRIRMLFSKEGSTEVTQAAQQLTQSTEDLGKATEHVNVTGQKSHVIQGKNAQAMQTARGEAERLKNTFGAMNQMADGSFGGMLRMGQLLNSQLGILAARAGAVLAAFKTGWDVGIKLDKWITDMGTAAGAAGDLGIPVRKTREELDKLNEAKFDKLTAEIKAVGASTDELLGKMAAVNANTDKLRDAETALAVKLAESTMPAGPEREKKIAEIKTGAKRDALAADMLGQQDVIDKRSSDIAEAEKKKQEAQAAMDAAQKQYDTVAGRVADAQKSGQVSPELLRLLKEARGNLESTGASGQKTMAEADAKITDLQQQVDQAKAELATLTAQMASMGLDKGADQASIAAAAKALQEIAKQRVTGEQSQGMIAYEPDYAKDGADRVKSYIEQALNKEAEDVRKALEAVRNPAQPSPAETAYIEAQKADQARIERILSAFATGQSDYAKAVIDRFAAIEATQANLIEVIKRLPTPQ